MRNLSIRFQLFGSLLIPIIALLVFSSNLLMIKIKVNNEMSKYSSVTEFAVKISNLVHETQKERGASAGFLGSRGEKFGDVLKKQRALTDEKLGIVETYISSFDFENFDARFSIDFQEGMKELSRLKEIRQKVDSFNITVQEEVAYYTKINGLMLSAVGDIGFMMTDAEISKELNAYANFLLSKERAGIERAVLSNTFAADKFAAGLYERLIVLMTEQESFLKSFELMANEEFVSFYKNTVKGEAVDEVARMRKVAMDNHVNGGFGIDSAYWFSTITKKINLLKTTEDHFAEEILKLMADKKTSTWMAKVVYTTLFSVSVVSLIILMFVIVRVVLRNINKLAASITDLTQGNGDLTKRLYMKEKNEVGMLYDNINEFVANIDRNLSNTLTHVSKASDAVVPLISIVSDTTLSAQNSFEMSGQVSAASTQMSTTIQEIADNINDATMQMNEAVSLAMAGKESIDDVNKSSDEVSIVMEGLKVQINNLQQEAEKIGDVISVINDIADQTNLLALNAAIEAARAGDAGRGFAVVADEVRKLAEKTQQSTSEIASVINNVRNDVKDTVMNAEKASGAIDNQTCIISNVSESFEKIVGSVENVNGHMVSVAAAMEEQTITTAEIADRIAYVANDASLMLDKSSDLANSTSSIVDSLQMMDEEFAKFKLSNKAIPLIRAKISHAVFLSDVQKNVQDPSHTFPLTDHNSCGFGELYHTSGQEVYGQFPEYRELEPIHMKVHEFGNEIAEAARTQSVATKQDTYEGFRHAIGEMVRKLNILIDKVHQ